MKKAIIALLIVLPSLALGQNIDNEIDPTEPARKGRSIASRQQPIAEIRVLKAFWAQGFDEEVIASIIAEICDRAGIGLGADTRELLGEIEERDSLTSERARKWVRQDSERFSRQSLEPATVRLEVVTWGDAGQSRDRVRLGRDSIELESGWSIATATVTVRDLVSGRVLGVIRAKGERKSTNLESIDFGSRWSWRGLGFGVFGFDRYDDNSIRRRALLAIDACCRDLQSQLTRFRQTGRVGGSTQR